MYEDLRVIQQNLGFNILFPIFIFLGLLFSIARGASLVLPIDASVNLSLSKLYINEYAIVYDWAAVVWSSIHQLSSLLINIGLSPIFLANILSLIGSIALLVGVSLILRRIKVSVLFIIPLTLLLCLFPTLPSLSGDYLFQGIGTPHLSHFSLSFVILSLGLALSGKPFSSGFFSFLTISIHPFFGAFFAFFISAFIFFEYTQKKYSLSSSYIQSFIKGSLAGLTLTLISASYFFIGYPSSENLEIDIQAYSTYMELWDYHRNVSFSYTPVILNLSFAAIFLLLKKILSLYDEIDESLISFICLLLFLSSGLYLLSEFINTGLINDMLETISPGRFMILNGIFVFVGILYYLVQLSDFASLSKNSSISLGVALFLCFTLIIINQDFYPLFFQELSRNLIVIFSLVILPLFSLLFFILIRFYRKKFLTISQNFFKGIFLFFTSMLLVIFLSDHNIFLDKKKCASFYPASPILIATRNELKELLRECAMPIIIDPENLDMIPYLPHKADELSRIISIGYGINYFDPPHELRKRGSINDNKVYLYKDIWESRTFVEWQIVKQQLNINEIAAPLDWDIDLPRVALLNQSAIYTLDNI
jgi:hypothetical protein